MLWNKTKLPRCIIHIGTEKTGTTTIQHFLSTNREELRQQGILYLESAGLHGAQWGFVALASSTLPEADISAALHIRNEKDLASFQKKFSKEIKREISLNKECHTLIISCEHFHSRLKNAAQIKALQEELSKFAEAFTVLGYFRRQDKLAVSQYSTKVKSGDPAPMVFPPTDMPLSYYFDYERIYRNWSEIFGSENFRTRLFDGKHLLKNDLIFDFCSATGIDPKGTRQPEKKNESLNQAGIDFITEVNRQLPSIMNGHHITDQRQLIHFVATRCKGKAAATTRAEAISFYERCAESNLQFANAIGVPVEQLFDDDFSDYPVARKDIDRSYEDAVGLAISIWRHASISDNSSPSRLERELGDAHVELRKVRAENEYLRGVLAMRRSNWQLSQRMFNKAIALNPNLGPAHIELANVELKIGNIDKAQYHWNIAKPLLPAMNPAVKRIERLLALKREATTAEAVQIS